MGEKILIPKTYNHLPKEKTTKIKAYRFIFAQPKLIGKNGKQINFEFWPLWLFWDVWFRTWKFFKPKFE